MNKLFFELIRLSIGTSSTLSHRPSADEWAILYKMAVKQSLVGVCFSGVRKYMAQHCSGEAIIPSNIYYQWLGIAVHIQKRNEWLNKCCVEFEHKLSQDGFRSCVLKGQGLAALYGNLSNLRQSGDIDTWAIGEPREIIEWARETGSMTYYDYHHADLSLYKETEIELHYRPTLSRNLLRNARLQSWFQHEGKKHISFKENIGFTVPDYIFNVVLTINHNFWHLLYEGVGLRQILDLYFVLKSIEDYGSAMNQKREEVSRLINYFHLKHFASASMWIMKEVFKLEDRYLICEPDKNAGRFLLDEILQSGNFGKYDKRLNGDRYESRASLMVSWIKHNSRLLRYYPIDVLWTPFGITRISLWRRWHNKFD